MLFLVALGALAQIPGSVRTVDPAAAAQDLFGNRQDVFLAAGSVGTPCRAVEFLADGAYYFQVTDAMGGKLLSPDPVNERRFTVKNGVISSYDGTTHAADGKTGCNSLSISLSPFDDVGFRKAAYLLWVTPVASFAGHPTDVGPVCGEGCFFGFRPELSRTFAFRVEDKRNCEPTFCVSGTAFADTNGDGVRDTGEAGLSDVAVQVSGPGGVLFSGYSGSDGGYRICGLTSTDTFLVHEAVPNGYRQTGPKDRRISKSLIAKDLGYTVVVCCLSFDGLDFGNQQIPGAIGGVVYEDRNANGARDPGEPPLSGATVTLTQTDPPDAVRTVVTGASGEYLFDKLPPASYGLEQTPPAGYTQTQPVIDGYQITLAAGGTFNTIFGDFKGTLKGSLSGFVFNDVNGNGVRDSGEPGMAGVTVTLVAGTATVTAADGSFRFDNLAFGTYTLSETVPAGYTQTVPPAPGTITATLDFSHQNVTGLLFGNFFPPTGSIAGDKWLDLEENGIVDGIDFPLSGIVFVLTDGGGQQRTTSSGTDGTYRFTNLPAGTYDLKEVLPPGFWQTFPGTKTDPKGYTIILAPGENKTGFRFLNKC